MVDWSKLKLYEENRWKSFEEFCFSIANRLYHDKGDFTPIDDSGGGDGVEFYLTLPDGTEWGWQTKFYHPYPRLNVSGRKKSIQDSLKRAIEKHKRLKKWYLCTPTDFTPNGETKWFKELGEEYPNITLLHWGEAEFNNFLTYPQFVGIKKHYFGELELSIDWFKDHIGKQIRIVGNKFIPSLHIENPVDFKIHTLLCDSFFYKYINEQLKYIIDKKEKFDITVEELNEMFLNFKSVENKDETLAYLYQLKTLFSQIIILINNIKDHISTGQYEKIKNIDWKLIEEEFRDNLENYSRICRELKEKFELKDEEGGEKEAQNIKQKIWDPFFIANEIAENFLTLRRYIDETSEQVLHIFGGAGIGKTHIACHIAQERISKGLPAILLLGKHFTSEDPIENQILKRLGVPDTYSWEDFIQALQSAAGAYKTKIPIIIDALNEAHNIDKWKNEIPGFIYNIEKVPQIILVTTCRSNYRKAIWHISEPKHAIETYGFAPDSLEDAIIKYFDWYKIKCDLTLAPLRQFSDPIFLRIFCESQNKEREEDKQIYLGEQTLLQTFDDYIHRCNNTVCSKLSRHHSVPLVQNALENIAKVLWEQKSRYIPLSEAVKLIDSIDLVDLEWPKSITNALLDEGLLVARDMVHDEEVISFTYDLLGGYIIAKEEAETLCPENIQDYVNSDVFERYLLSQDYSKKHPLHEDILRCFALIFPMKFDKHLYELTEDQTVYNYSIRALFEMSPEHIEKSKKEIIHLFSFPENRKPLFNMARTNMIHFGHPLNIDFWDELLRELSIPERDLCWTEFIRRNAQYFFNELERFENTCKERSSYSDITEERLLLAAKFYSWLLTSTVRDLRDTATRALYWYGRRFPSKFFDLVFGALSINDQYVSERIIAAAYGVTMALHCDLARPEFSEEILPYNTEKLYDAMFKPEAPHGTTHILSRDNARLLINIALLHNPEILTTEEKSRIEPPFIDGGIRDWGESEEKDIVDYREGSGPIHSDFGNYTMGRLVEDRRNYDFENEEYKKVRANILWRMYDLGYSHDLFSEIDREINRHNWRLGRATNGRKIDRYGKKYSWIAFYELAGYREDNDLLPKLYSDRQRISDVDIDPSFPESVQEFEVIKRDYLGDRSIDVTEWIENGGVPELTPYFIVEKLCDEHGPWVLLDGYINQEDLEARRARFIFPRGLLVKKDKSLKIVECLKNQNLGGRWLPEIPEDYYTYAGEIPWCETFPYNGISKMDFVIGSRIERVPEKGVARLRDGTVLTINELLSILLEKKRDLTSKENIETLLEEEGIEQIETTIYRDKEIKETTSFKSLIPVRYYNWENYHSTVNRAAPALVLAKELIEALDLCSQPQTFDLYEKNGRRASITLRWGEPYHSQQDLICLRQDLLERYLKEKNAEFVWAIWGERGFRSKDIEELDEFRKEHISYRVFQTIETYSNMKKNIATYKSSSS